MNHPHKGMCQKEAGRNSTLAKASRPKQASCSECPFSMTSPPPVATVRYSRLLLTLSGSVAVSSEMWWTASSPTIWTLSPSHSNCMLPWKIRPFTAQYGEGSPLSNGEGENIFICFKHNVRISFSLYFLTHALNSPTEEWWPGSGISSWSPPLRSQSRWGHSSLLCGWFDHCWWSSERKTRILH